MPPYAEKTQGPEHEHTMPRKPELLIYISKGLYVEISAEYHTSIGCVERNIRTIISTIWLHGDRTLLNQVFGFELEQKPRNGAFIDALSHYVVEHYYD